MPYEDLSIMPGYDLFMHYEISIVTSCCNMKMLKVTNFYNLLKSNYISD